ncbi:hypothetical protein GE118_02400 [Mycoplasma sp. NEAQ87857]|uniref:DIP1984 family protein n=1 Tax=Mycoplasma sp. NEAQ87857 TaxID=2683967 RepID=UPI0013165B0E|nr:DIP1984 family protein [Mycoplasma sp. NEAQ87857]QGZ97645.1 hypothetical protein GE118_02400 [Mycoplasma sp. NEAQ87857]
MLLAELLNKRTTLQKEMGQIKIWLKQNSISTVGNENNKEWLEKYDLLCEYEVELQNTITLINETNNKVKAGNFQNINAMLLQRDLLNKKISFLEQITETIQNAKREEIRAFKYQKEDVKITPMFINALDFQEEILKLKNELKKLENLIQRTNWTTEV